MRGLGGEAELGRVAVLGGSRPVALRPGEDPPGGQLDRGAAVLAALDHPMPQPARPDGTP